MGNEREGNWEPFSSTIIKAVVRVGEGRGFIIRHREMLPAMDMDSQVVKVKVNGKPTSVEIDAFKRERRFRDRRFVVTSAHCLPYFPPCIGASYTGERTYESLLGTLDARKPSVWAECLFADPVADIAVLDSPDDQKLPDEAEEYERLIMNAPALRIGTTTEEGASWVLRLDGHWHRCVVNHHGKRLWIESNAEIIEGGMSGSPILTDNAKAIGVVCLSSSSSGSHGPNPRLTNDLPGWLLPLRRRAR